MSELEDIKDTDVHCGEDFCEHCGDCLSCFDCWRTKSGGAVCAGEANDRAARDE